MHEYVEKPKERKNKAVANYITQGKNNVKQGFSIPIQRKVGLEIETPCFLLYSGNMRRAPKPQKHRYDERSHLIESSDKKHYGGQEQPFEGSSQKLVKGKTIIGGQGWKLTADIIGGQGIIEYITDPVDETDKPQELEKITSQIQIDAEKLFGKVSVHEYKQLKQNVVLRRIPGELEGNIHITGGIKPDKIIKLMEQMDNWKGENILKVDKSSRAVLSRAVQSATNITFARGGAKYQGLVALLGSYVAGQRRYRLMAEEAYEYTRSQEIIDSKNEEVIERIKYCADVNDIEEFMRTGDITNSDEEIKEIYGENGKNQFLDELRNILHIAVAPRAAKIKVPILSRSSLAELKGKVIMPRLSTFIKDVMTAAGEPGGNADTALFPLGLDTPGHAGRTIEAKPNITVRKWLQSIYAGQNLKFTDVTKSFEKVGPSNVPCLCGFSTTREKGVVLEIRALDGRNLVPSEDWVSLANTVSQTFRDLNED